MIDYDEMIVDYDKKWFNKVSSHDLIIYNM